MSQTASRISRLTLNTDRTVSEGSIKVHTIYVSNATAAPVEVVFLDLSDIPLLNMTIGAYDSESFNAIWLADNGLKISGLGDANVVVTVAHSQDGA